MKSGFTLVELLAVIVILAVISLIAVVSVKPLISSSKTKLSETNIKKIEEIAEAFYINEGVSTLDTCINVSELIDKGYIKGNLIKDPKVGTQIEGSVKVNYKSNKYTYTYQERACPTLKCEYDDENSNNSLDLYENVTCGANDINAGESFHVIEFNAEGNVEMLANYNLKLSKQSPRQDPQDTGFPSTNGIGFSEINYWTSDYPKDADAWYVYDENSNLYEYLVEYKNELDQLGLDIIDVKLMSKSQADVFSGCYPDPKSHYICDSAKSWLVSTSYWLGGSIENLTGVYTISSNNLYRYTSYRSTSYGIRPVVVISQQNIIKKEI